jgi:hypothetical protein
MHELSVEKVRAWLEGGGKSPNEHALKLRLREMFGSAVTLQHVRIPRGVRRKLGQMRDQPQHQTVCTPDRTVIPFA